MDINKLFRSYKQKLLLESIIKALLFAFMVSGASVFAVSLIYHLMVEETPLSLTALIGGSIFSVSFLLLFFLYYPTKKRVAARMDEIGLQERIRTMLEYQNEETEIAKIQRQDAIEQIGKTTSKQMKFRFVKRDLILCAVSIGMAFLMMILPYNVLAFGSSDDTINAEQAQIIKELIEQLREEVENANLDDGMKDSLNDIIDELEADLSETDSELERAAKIEQAKKKMEALLEQALTKNKIGEALQMYELTRALGEAISDGNTVNVSAALDELEVMLTEDTSLVTTLSETLSTALTVSGVDPSDELYTALLDFSSELFDLDSESAAFSEKLASAFDTAEAAILSALEKQAIIESEKEELEEAMSDAKDKVLGNEKEESEEDSSDESGETPDGEKDDGSEGEPPDGAAPGGEQPDGEAPEGEPSDGQGGEYSGDGNGDGSSMTEGIYDPVSGSVTYGEVFAAYYAEYLAALETGEVPDDLQEIVDQYFSALN